MPGLEQQSGILLKEIGSKVLKLSHRKIKGQSVERGTEQGGFRTLTLTNHTGQRDPRYGVGTYTLSATFKPRKGAKLRAADLVEAGVGANAGGGGPDIMLDLWKRGSRTAFPGSGFLFRAQQEMSADHPDGVLHGATRPFPNGNPPLSPWHESLVTSAQITTFGDQAFEVIDDAIHRRAIQDLPPIFPDQPS